MAQENHRVQVIKVDLDTVGAAFLLGVTRQDVVEVLCSEASQEDLTDPSVLCIEAGGSGMVEANCFDHHMEGGPTASATLQAFDRVFPVETCMHGLHDCSQCEHIGGRRYGSARVAKLVEYIDLFDTRPEVLRAQQEGVSFPTLSDVFSGLLRSERDPVEQLHKGVELLGQIVETVANPFGTVPGFDSYAEAKAENDRQMAKAVELARWETTSAGRRLAILETEFFGAPGALYGAGANIVVCFNPCFGNPPVAKFTVAGNGITVSEALPALNALEEGWGGPATGTIIGSPRSGSKLTLEQVAGIVREAC
jgi:hypothetical protein